MPVRKERIMKGKKHLTVEQRVSIKQGLDGGKSFRNIADEAGVSPTTVSREVRGHLRTERKGAYGRAFNDCRLRLSCPEAGPCEGKPHCKRLSCSYCRPRCAPSCPSYKKEACPRLDSPPYCCNGCPERSSCTLEKRIYDAFAADKEYRASWSDGRKGVRCSEEELRQLTRTVSDGFSRGQSLGHICSVCPSLPVSQRTLYEYVNNRVLGDSMRLDEPRAVRYRARRRHAKEDAAEGCLTGRTYNDFRLRMDSDPDLAYVEMDCVEGRRSGNGKVLLTLLFPSSNLQIAYLMEEHTQRCVSEVFKGLRARLGTDLYKRLFPIILTDRGHEFMDPGSIEMTESGELVSEVFYCDPGNPNQKARCERNHAEIRRFIRKGADITQSQEEISAMMDNINALARPTFGNKSAYDMFVFIHGQEAADRLGLKKVSPKDAMFSPELFG